MRRAIVGTILAGLCGLAILAVCGVLTWRAWLRYQVTSAGTVTTCRVEAAKEVHTPDDPRDDEMRGDQHTLEVTVTFEVDGVTHEAKDHIGDGSEKDARELARTHRRGTEVDCWYLPERPVDTCTLEPQSLGEARIGLIAGGIISLAAVLIVVGGLMGEVRRVRAIAKTLDDLE